MRETAEAKARPPLIKDLPRLLHARAELLRIAGPSPELHTYLKRHHLDLESCIAHAGFMTISLCKFWTGNDGDETFSFNTEGFPAATIEAILFEYDGEPYTADLVAWPIHDPDGFATVMGHHDGADILGPVSMTGRRGAPLRVHPHPLAWLRAGCEGCVPLTPGARHWLKRAGGPFAVATLDEARDLRDLIGPEAAMRNRILVDAGSEKVAA
jgi:hypothetical protein